jgi:Ca-activated chloride channel family protein
MPELTRPLLLLPALLVPFVVWWWLRRRGRAFAFPDAAALATLASPRTRMAHWGGAVLRGLALLLLVVALAGPRWPDLRSRLPVEGIAIVFVVDVSGSMAERDYLWQGEPVSRLDAVKRVLRQFVVGGVGPTGDMLPGRPNDQVGLVAFASRPESVCPLTLSHSALLKLMDEQQPRSLPTESRTNVGDALAWGLHTLESAGPRRQVLVLVSDGEHNVPAPALTPRQAAQLAAGRSVPVHVIDAGDAEAAGKDRETAAGSLQAVAQLTGGQSFQARDTQALLDVCRRIDRLERREAESFQYRRYHEGYPWLAAAGLACLLLVQALEGSTWRRLP